MRLICALALYLLLLSSPRVALAGDISGVYVKQYTNALYVLNLTETAGNLTGYFQDIRVDATQSGGTANRRYNVSGTHSGSHIVLNLNMSIFGSSGQWTGSTSWSGLNVDIPQQSGQIAQITFRRSSISELNQMVYSISAFAGRNKSMQDAQAQYEAATSELARLQGDRPAILAELSKARAALVTAQGEVAVAESEVVRRKGIEDAAKATAEEASRAAQTNEEHQHAIQLGSQAISRGSEVITAQSHVISAQGHVTSAKWRIERYVGDLRRTENRIAVLKRVIAADRAVLHR